jgi:DNA-binding transcriptional MerR regulator
VTVRALRYYDAVGLLSPERHEDSGYRLYAEEDLLTLQQILALKFLGFSLDDIKRCLRRGPRQIPEMLARQKAMLRERRDQIDAILRAIERAEAVLAGDGCDLESIAGVIRVIQMEQKGDWVTNYFTDDQLKKMEEISAASYSEAARDTLRQRGGQWTEEDQKRADEQWRHVATESARLAAAGADPAGEEAQTLARFKSELLHAFTQGDPEVEAGLSRFWETVSALPREEQPIAWSSAYGGTAEGDVLLDRAMTIYQERLQSGGA